MREGTVWFYNCKLLFTPTWRAYFAVDSDWNTPLYQPGTPPMD